MRSVKFVVGLALAASVAATAPAQAGNHGSSGSNPGHGNGAGAGNSGGGVVVVTPLAACALSDISVAASACAGFFAGNLLSDSPSDLAAQADALDDLGLTAWTGSIVEPQMNLSTSTVNFSSALYGLTYIGIHFGSGAASPSPGTPGGVTGFYRFDAGSNLDAFTLAFGAASAARLYVTQPAPPTTPGPLGPLIDPPSSPDSLTDGPLGAIPEPATWLMMILGFGAIGSVMRARRRATVA